jgi:hypothetical protein
MGFALWIQGVSGLVPTMAACGAQLLPAAGSTLAPRQLSQSSPLPEYPGAQHAQKILPQSQSHTLQIFTFKEQLQLQTGHHTTEIYSTKNQHQTQDHNTQKNRNSKETISNRNY